MSDRPALANLPALPYIDADGQLPATLQGKVGVYAILDEQQTLQFIGYSRDIALSLQQHLVRQPHRCYWVKAYLVDRPSRTLLEDIRAAWIAENGSIPPGNESDRTPWTEAIDVRPLMTAAEQANYAAAIDELAQAKVLKQAARRIEEEILSKVSDRGLQMQLRFNPKLKETGILDLK